MLQMSILVCHQSTLDCLSQSTGRSMVPVCRFYSFSSVSTSVCLKMFFCTVCRGGRCIFSHLFYKSIRHKFLLLHISANARQKTTCISWKSAASRKLIFHIPRGWLHVPTIYRLRGPFNTFLINLRCNCCNLNTVGFLTVYPAIIILKTLIGALLPED